MNRRDFLKTCVALGASLALSPEAIAAALPGLRVRARPDELLYAINAMGSLDSGGWYGVFRGAARVLQGGVGRGPGAWRAPLGCEIVWTDDLSLNVSEGVVAEFVFSTGRVVFISDSETTEMWSDRAKL